MKFRKRPVVVDAWQWNGEDKEKFPYWLQGRLDIQFVNLDELTGLRLLLVDTQHGNAECSEGDWLIKGIKGELYPCKDDVLQATYERVDE